MWLLLTAQSYLDAVVSAPFGPAFFTYLSIQFTISASV